MQCIIENCEEKLSEWLYLEYKHAANIWHGKLCFTNVREERMYALLSNLTSAVFKEHVYELALENLIVLDPLAEKSLEPEDMQKADYIVIGGILGDREFTGKTKRLITEKIKGVARNLGKTQLSIDIAAYVAYQVLQGKRLSEIPLTVEVEIEHPDGHITVLPYGYPIVDGKVLITPGLIRYLQRSMGGQE
ncbi:MAG: SAM-dependent methyltransferase [Thermoplasmata archaeon]|nr:SAM-dependent methyltransferase [Thermoplasmata archaeon]